MFTWNFQLISKARLADTFDQLKLDVSRGYILIRIHTASHRPDEAVELAKYIVKLVPGAHIFGTSTSAIIMNGKLIPNQCLISITQMSKGSIRTELLSTYNETGEEPLTAEEVCAEVTKAVVGPDTRFLLTR